MRFLRTRSQLVGLLILAVLAIGVAFAPSRAMVSAQSSDIVLAFEGRVTRGPSDNTRLEGILTLTPGEDGSLSGELALLDGSATVPVSGRIGAGNLSVAFDLGAGGIIFGIGTPNSQGGFSGRFVGPATGDEGRWKSAPVSTVALNFTGTVSEGANEGVTLAGPLTINVNPLDDDKFTGVLVVEGVGTLPVSGELDNNGRKIELTFDASVLGAGLTIEGEGRRTPEGGYAGHFEGPAADDEGDWTATAQ